jgi:hypothetical protein
LGDSSPAGYLSLGSRPLMAAFAAIDATRGLSERFATGSVASGGQSKMLRNLIRLLPVDDKGKKYLKLSYFSPTSSFGVSTCQVTLL